MFNFFGYIVICAQAILFLAQRNLNARTFVYIDFVYYGILHTQITILSI